MIHFLPNGGPKTPLRRLKISRKYLENLFEELIYRSSLLMIVSIV